MISVVTTSTAAAAGSAAAPNTAQPPAKASTGSRAILATAQRPFSSGTQMVCRSPTSTWSWSTKITQNAVPIMKATTASGEARRNSSRAAHSGWPSRKMPAATSAANAHRA